MFFSLWYRTLHGISHTGASRDDQTRSADTVRIMSKLHDDVYEMIPLYNRLKRVTWGDGEKGKMTMLDIREPGIRVKFSIHTLQPTPRISK